MRTFTALILGLACLCCCTTAARLDPVMLDETLAAGQGNLQASSRAWLDVMRMGELGKRRSSEKDMEEEEGLHNRIFAIRFDVPPSESKKFEDMWMKMDKDEKDANVFTLKSSALDNVFYYSYGEFKKHRDLHDHLMSDHFNDFAEYVDKHGIHWSLELLNDLSYETERKAEKHKGRKNELSVTALATLPNKGVDATDDQVLSLYNTLTRRKESAHILINYYVQPGMIDSFIDEWTKMAEKTLEEPGNHVYSLRKSATDNARVVAYGSWDSYRDYMDHVESKHLQKFVDWLDDHNMPFFIRPLDTVE